MTQPASPVPSPCIDVCRMDEARGWCTGCLRTLDEIAAWSTLDEAAKRAVWQRLPVRRTQVPGLHGEAPGRGTQEADAA